MAHFHQRRRTRIRNQIRTQNPIVTLYYAQLFPLVQIRIQMPIRSFPNGYCTHFRDGSLCQASESEFVSVGGNEPLQRQNATYNFNLYGIHKNKNVLQLHTQSSFSKTDFIDIWFDFGWFNCNDRNLNQSYGNFQQKSVCISNNLKINMSHFAYACKTERQNGISHLISELLRTLNSSLRDHLFMLQNEVFRTT